MWISHERVARVTDILRLILCSLNSKENVDVALKLLDKYKQEGTLMCWLNRWEKEVSAASPEMDIICQMKSMISASSLEIIRTLTSLFADYFKKLPGFELGDFKPGISDPFQELNQVLKNLEDVGVLDSPSATEPACPIIDSDQRLMSSIRQALRTPTQPHYHFKVQKLIMGYYLLNLSFWSECPNHAGILIEGNSDEPDSWPHFKLESSERQASFDLTQLGLEFKHVVLHISRGLNISNIQDLRLNRTINIV